MRERREKRKLEQEQEIRRKKQEFELLLGASPTSRLLVHQITLAQERGIPILFHLPDEDELEDSPP